jgi:hypothetical protein
VGSEAEGALEGRRDSTKIRDTVWLNQAVQKLIKAGHDHGRIAEYTLDQFLIFLDAVEQLDAAARANFVTDMTAVVGGMFGSGKTLSELVESLSRLATGEHDGRAK